jgi:hypothetical protein
MVHSTSFVHTSAVQRVPTVQSASIVQSGPNVSSSAFWTAGGAAGTVGALASHTRLAIPFAERAMMWAKSGDDSTSASARANAPGATTNAAHRAPTTIPNRLRIGSPPSIWTPASAKPRQRGSRCHGEMVSGFLLFKLCLVRARTQPTGNVR